MNHTEEWVGILPVHIDRTKTKKDTKMQNQNSAYGASDHGFRRGMARELLIHNSTVTTVEDALSLAQELIDATAATPPPAGIPHAYIQPTD